MWKDINTETTAATATATATATVSNRRSVQFLGFDSSINSIASRKPSIKASRTQELLQSSSRLLRKIPSRVLTWTLFAVAVMPWLGHSSQNRQVRSLQKTLQGLMREHRKLLAGLEHLGDDMSRTARLAREIELDNKELTGLLASASASLSLDPSDDASVDIDGSTMPLSTLSLYREAEDLENAYLARIEHMEESIQARSLERIVKSYPQVLGTNYNSEGGDGKLYVGIRLERLGLGAGNVTASSSQQSSTLVLETEPIDSMPHAIDYFLRLAVEAQYYSGGEFALIHQPSVVASAKGKAVPKRTHPIHTVLRHRQPLLTQQQQPNKQTILTHRSESNATDDSWDLTRGMAFAERSHHRAGDRRHHPRVGKYSVVFHRSGGSHGATGGGTGLHHDVAVGPHFAIHMATPSAESAPTSRDADEAAEAEEDKDPEDDWDHDYEVCFGRIIQGQDVLDRMVEASSKAKRQQLIGIESVELIVPAALKGET